MTAPTLSSPPMALCVLLITIGFCVCESVAQVRKDPKKPLAAPAEKELAAFIDQCEPEKRKQLIGHMHGVLKAINEATTLSAEETDALKQEAAKIVDSSVVAWRPCFAEALRSYLIRWPSAVAIRQIDQWRPEEAAVREPVEGWKLPDEEPAWAAVVKARLGGERFAAWRTAAEAAARKRNGEIDAYVKKWSEEYRNNLNRSIQAKMGHVPAALASSQERMNDLKKAAEALLDRVIESEQKRAFAMLSSVPDEAREQMVERDQFSIRYAMNTTPSLDRLWEEELKRTLQKEDFEMWQRWVAEEKAKFDKELPIVLKPRLDQMRDLWRLTLEMVAGDVGRLAGLPKERMKDFEPAIKAALEDTEKVWMKLAREQASSVDVDALHNIIESGGFYIVLEGEDAPQNSAPWNDAVRKLLSPAELRQLEIAKAERRDWRVRLAAQVLISELDQKVAFTSLQRQALQPIAERLVKGVSELFREFMPMYGYDMRPQIFLAAAKKANEAEMMSILDRAQWKHWQEACNSPPKPPVAAKADHAATQIPLEPEELEKRVSNYLYERSKLERRRSLSDMLLRTEDVTRVASLPDQAVMRLQLAAKGAVEQCLVSWNTRTEQIVRGQLQEATPQNVQQRLEALQEYNFSQRDVALPAAHALWTGAIKASLNEAQRAAWQKETEARKAYRDQSIAGAVVAEFDRRYSLSSEQGQKLLPMIAKLISEYHEDIQNYFSSSVPWFMQSYSCLLPFAGLPEAELKSVLDKAQWDSWSGEGLSNTAQYWESIKSNHTQRRPAKK